jgi:rubrerythrin
MAQTDDNLKAAFAGESQANQRYLSFSKKAEQDGYPNIGKLFRAAAAAETVHAGNHFRVALGIGETLDNLQAAKAGEHDEIEDMYPGFIETANKEGNEDAAETFNLALQVERIHRDLYGKAAESLEKGKDLPTKLMFVCRGCGNTVAGAPPEECPICGAPQHWFMHIT